MIIIIKKDTTVKIRTRFIKEKMFVKVSLMSFVYNIIDVFCFPTTEVLDIYKQKKIIKCIGVQFRLFLFAILKAT